MKNLITILSTLFLFIHIQTQAQWVQSSSGIGNDHTVFSIATTGGKIFAGVAYANTSIGDGVYRSDDNGLTWNILPLDPNGTTGLETYNVAVSGSTVYIGTDYFIWKSTNYGNTWSLLPGWSHAIRYIALKGNTVYAASGRYIWVSYNGGNTFTQRTSNTDSSYFNCLAVYGNYLYAGTTNNYKSGSVIRSADDGQTWTTLFTVSNEINTIFNEIQSLAFQGDNIYAGTLLNGVYRSPDLGVTWQPTALTTSNGSLKSLVTNGTDVIAGTLNGVYLSKDSGSTWTATNDGFVPFPQDANALCVANGYLFLGSVFSTVWRCSLSSLYTMDVKDGTLTHNMRIYPNPATDILTIDMGEPFNHDIQIDIYNFMGERVKSVTLPPGQQTIAVDDLRNGVYLLRAEGRGIYARQKLFIHH